MTGRAFLILAALVVGVAIPATATGHHSLLDFEAAVDVLWEADPLIDPPPNDPAKDFVVGGFQHGDRNNKVGLSGHSGALGEDPLGHVSETIPGIYQARFRVTCVAVLLNSAALGLVPTDAGSNDQEDQFVLALFDSGLPGGTGDQFSFLPNVPAEMCAVGLHEHVFPIELGNILVHDTIPAP